MEKDENAEIIPPEKNCLGYKKVNVGGQGKDDVDIKLVPIYYEPEDSIEDILGSVAEELAPQYLQRTVKPVQQNTRFTELKNSIVSVVNNPKVQQILPDDWYLDNDFVVKIAGLVVKNNPQYGIEIVKKSIKEIYR
jgi:hypothetical protein